MSFILHINPLKVLITLIISRICIYFVKFKEYNNFNEMTQNFSNYL